MTAPHQGRGQAWHLGKPAERQDWPGMQLLDFLILSCGLVTGHTNVPLQIMLLLVFMIIVLVVEDVDRGRWCRLP